MAGDKNNSQKEIEKKKKAADKALKAELERIIKEKNGRRQYPDGMYAAKNDDKLESMLSPCFSKILRENGIARGSVAEIYNDILSGKLKNKEHYQQSLEPVVFEHFDELTEAISTDLRNRTYIETETKKFLKTKKLPSSYLNEIKSFAKQKKLVPSKEKVAAQKALRARYDKVVTDFVILRGFNYHPKDRTIGNLLLNPKLSNEQRAEIIEKGKTKEGKLELYRDAAKHIMSLDINKIASITPEEYVENFHELEYQRLLVFDDLFAKDVDFVNSMEPAEYEAFKNYQNALMGLFNIVCKKCDALSFESADYIDIDKMTMDDSTFLSTEYMYDMFSASCYGYKAAADEKEKSLNDTIEAKKAYDDVLVKETWVDILKEKPERDASVISMLDKKVKTFKEKSDPEIRRAARMSLYDFAVSEIIGDFLNAGLEPEKLSPDKKEYLNKIKTAIPDILARMEKDEMILPAQTKDVLKELSAAEPGALSKKLLNHAIEEAINTPKQDEVYLEKLITAQKKIIESDLEKTVVNPPIKYHTSNSTPYTDNVNMVNQIEHYYLKEAYDYLGLAWQNSMRMANLIESNPSPEEFAKEISTNHGKYNLQDRGKKDTNLINKFIRNYSFLRKFAEIDKAERENRAELKKRMLENAKGNYPVLNDVEKLKEFAENNGLTIDKNKQKNYAKWHNIVAENNISRVFDYDEDSASNKRCFKAFLSLPGLTNDDKKLISDTFFHNIGDVSKGYDLIVDKIANLDLEIFSGDNDMGYIFDHHKEFMKLKDFIWDRDSFFENMRLDKAQGKYCISDEKFKALKDFLGTVQSRITKITTKYDFYEFPEAEYIDVDKINMENANVGVSDPAYNKFFARASLLVYGCDSIEQIKDAQKKVFDIFKKEKAAFDEIGRQKSQSAKEINELVNKDLSNAEESEMIESADKLIEKLAKLVYLDDVKKQIKDGKITNMDEALSEKKLDEAVKALTPGVERLIAYDPQLVAALSDGKTLNQDVLDDIGSQVAEMAQNIKNEKLESLELENKSEIQKETSKSTLVLS